MEHQDAEVHEKRALAEVRERLTKRFPDVDPDEVDTAVAEALARLDGPVRDFVPILVERAAAKKLGSATTREAY